MSTDWYTRLVLTVIAVCLALMVVHGSGASGPEADRYRLTPLPMARMMLRFDSETGKTWKAMFPDLNIWTPVADSPDELLGQAADEAVGEAPAPPVPEVMVLEAPPVVLPSDPATP